jgi:hypothetical protein
MPTLVTPVGRLPAFLSEAVMLLHHSAQPDAEHIRFVHACLGSPPPNYLLAGCGREMQGETLTCIV